MARTRVNCLIFLLFISSLGVVKLAISDEFQHELQEIIETCIKQEQLKSDSLQKALHTLSTLPNTTQEACFHRCVLKSHGLIENGIYEWTKARNHLEDFVENNPGAIDDDDLDKMMDVINYCEEQVIDHFDDECQLARVAMLCKHKRADEIGLKMEFEEEEFHLAGSHGGNETMAVNGTATR